MTVTCGLCGAVIPSAEQGLPVPHELGPASWICVPYCRGRRRRIE